MEKQLTVRIPGASGEEGLTEACKRGELFRYDSELEHFFRQGYRVHDYAIEEEVKPSKASRMAATLVKVFLRK